jgi:hypothetical protein
MQGEECCLDGKSCSAPVNVTKHIEASDGRRDCRVVIAANGCIKFPQVMVNGGQNSRS